MQKKKKIQIKEVEEKGQMTLLPSINSIHLLPHAGRRSTTVPKRKWLPLSNCKVHFLKIQAKKQKESYTVSGVPKTLPRWKIHPWLRFIYSDILSLHSWILFPSITEKGITCVQWSCSREPIGNPASIVFIGGDERNGHPCTLSLHGRTKISDSKTDSRCPA